MPVVAAFAACAACGVACGAVCTAAIGVRLWRRHALRLVTLADADPLTGLANRRAIVRWNPAGGSGAWVAYVDVDRFKCVNDHHGHAAGDRLLQVVANLLGRSVRPGDLVARVGGDEFVVALADCTGTEALGVIERVQRGLSRGVLGCTLSVGLCEVPAGRWVWGDAAALGSAVDAADAALREAKRQGRGSVVLAPASAERPARVSRVAGSGGARALRP